jgi:hypothetical protein
LWYDLFAFLEHIFTNPTKFGNFATSGWHDRKLSSPTMLTRGGRFRQVASRIHVTSSRLTSSHNQLADSNDTPFKLKLIVPPSAEPQEITFTDNTALYDFVKSYQGSLRETGPNGQPCIIIGPAKYRQLLPTEIYSVHSPFFNATSDERQHS